MALIKHSVRTVRRACSKCGSKDLYWGHDDLEAGKPGAHFCSEHSSSSWVLINRDGTRHDCQGRYAATGESEETPEPADLEDDQAPPQAAPVPSLAPVPAALPGDAQMQALAALQTLLTPSIDANQVQAIIDDRLRGLVLLVQVEVKRNGEVRKLEGLAHKILPVVITILNSGDNVMMVGPAGTGKSHIAGQAAEALGLESYSISLSPQTPTSSILGYMQATGDYVRSLFREAYEHGGVFHFDEVDNSHPSVLAVINAALTNGRMAFPDGMVKRHPDFRCVASANTYGRGPDRAYVGRQAMDMATLDRFEIVTVEVDQALEEALCLTTGLDGIRVKAVLEYVRHLRSQAERHKLPISFSPRRSKALCNRLAGGMKAREAIEYSVRRGISEPDWIKVSDGAPKIA